MTIQLYVLRQLLVSVAFSLGGISLFVLPTITVQAVHKLGGAGVGLLLEYLPLTVLQLTPYLLPVGFLLGVVATFGRMAAEHELTAVRMAGVHPGRLLIPGLAMAFVLAGVTNWLISDVTPDWMYIQRSAIRRAKESSFKNLGRGRTEFELGDFYLKAGRRQPDSNVFHEVILNLPQQDGRALTIVADTVSLELEEEVLAIEWKNAQVLLDDGFTYNESPGARIPLSEILEHRAKDRDKPIYQTTSKLLRDLASGTLTAEQNAAYRFEVHSRRALSAIYFVFLLLGVSTGIFLRSGTQLGAFSIAFVYAFLYYVFAMRFGKQLTAVGAVPPEAAAWTTDALFLVLGATLVYRALWR